MTEEELLKTLEPIQLAIATLNDLLMEHQGSDFKVVEDANDSLLKKKKHGKDKVHRQ